MKIIIFIIIFPILLFSQQIQNSTFGVSMVSDTSNAFIINSFLGESFNSSGCQAWTEI